VITLAIDTTERRGSVAVVRDRQCLAAARHDWNADYSAWLLPAVQEVLGVAGTKMELLDLLAVATGPGSFTGLRVGLTTVKAWAEVYGKPVAGVSRLEAIARSAASIGPFIAATYDAQRGQLFGALYRQSEGLLSRIGDESVSAPEEFISFVDREAGKQPVHWVCLDPELIQNAVIVQRRLEAGDHIVVCSDELASTIGLLGEERASKGQFSDPLELDANYVRRSDAEIFWKDTPSRVR
jgi:tRNA threonylcarbamoyladenosine biosynthesis protein TsaB